MTTGFYRKLKHQWKYEVTIAESVEVPGLSGQYAELTTRDGRTLAEIDNGRIVAHPGYRWDGASGPAIDTDTWMLGSLFHDILYQFMRMGKLPRRFRPEADAMMRRVIRAEGMSWPRSWWSWAAVRFGGAKAAGG